MVTIGLGRNDPRRWVQTAYAVLEAIENGKPDSHDPVPSKAELTRKLSISAHTAGRALRELANMSIIYRVPGHGYFPTQQAGSDHLKVTKLSDEGSASPLHAAHVHNRLSLL